MVALVSDQIQTRFICSQKSKKFKEIERGTVLAALLPLIAGRHLFRGCETGACLRVRLSNPWGEDMGIAVECHDETEALRTP